MRIRMYEGDELTIVFSDEDNPVVLNMKIEYKDTFASIKGYLKHHYENKEVVIDAFMKR